MANTHLKICPTLLMIKEMKTNEIMYHFSQIGKYKMSHTIDGSNIQIYICTYTEREKERG